VISLQTGFMLPAIFLIIVVAAGISIGIRHFLTFLMAAIFPLTIFLYFFDLTREIGSKLMRYTVAAIFTQVVQAMILTVTIFSVNSASRLPGAFATLMSLFVAMGGFLLLVLAPLMTLGILKWVGGALGGLGAVVAFMPGKEALGGIMTAAGGMAAGMGPGGMMAGGTVYSLGKAYNVGKGSGGGPSRPIIREKMTKEDVLAAEKKKRQTDAHRQNVQGKSRTSIFADRDAQKYDKDSAQNLGSFMDRVEDENKPEHSHHPQGKSLTQKAQSFSKKAGVTMLAVAGGPAGWAGLGAYGGYKVADKFSQTRTGQMLAQTRPGQSIVKAKKQVKTGIGEVKKAGSSVNKSVTKFLESDFEDYIK
jgi:hypothetical protein